MNQRFTSPLWPLVPSLNFKTMSTGKIYEAGGKVLSYPDALTIVLDL